MTALPVFGRLLYIEDGIVLVGEVGGAAEAHGESILSWFGVVVEQIVVAARSFLGQLVFGWPSLGFRLALLAFWSRLLDWLKD